MEVGAFYGIFQDYLSLDGEFACIVKQITYYLDEPSVAAVYIQTFIGRGINNFDTFRYFVFNGEESCLATFVYVDRFLSYFSFFQFGRCDYFIKNIGNFAAVGLDYLPIFFEFAICRRDYLGESGDSAQLLPYFARHIHDEVILHLS